MQNVYKSNLNKISRGRYKPEEQKSALQNTELHQQAREVVVELFHDYSPIASEAKYKSIHGKIRTYDIIQKIAFGQGDIYTTDFLLDYPYFQKYYNMITIDLSKQQAPDADPKVIQ